MRSIAFAVLLVAPSLAAFATDVSRLDALQQRKDANQVEIDYLQSEVQLEELRRKTGRASGEVVLPLLTAITTAGSKKQAEFRHSTGTLRVHEGDLLIPGWTVTRIGSGQVALKRRGHAGTYFVRLGSPWPTRGS